MEYISTPASEQETVIRIGRNEDEAIIWTNDLTYYTKLDKKVKENPSIWKCEEVGIKDGKVTNKIYSCPKKLISFRANIVTREISDEQKQKMADRLRNSRSKAKN